MITVAILCDYIGQCEAVIDLSCNTFHLILNIEGQKSTSRRPSYKGAAAEPVAMENLHVLQSPVSSESSGISSKQSSMDNLVSIDRKQFT